VRLPGNLRTNRDFKRLWIAATISAFGTDISHTAFPFVAVLVLHASPWDLGLLSIASMLPAFVSGLFAGVWVDRLARRPIMIFCDWVRVAVLVSIPIAAWLAHLTLLHLALAAAFLSVASTFFDIADRSMLPSLVGREDLADANRMLTAGSTVAEASGFAAAGWLVQWLSAPGSMLVDAATYVWSAITLRRIERQETVIERDRETEQIGREIVDGLRFVRGNAILVGLGASLFLMYCAMQVVGTVYLLYVNQELGFDPGVLGLIFATGGLFSLIASLISGRVTHLIGVGPLLIGSMICVGAGQTLITLASAATLFAVVMMLFQQSMDLPWTLYEITQVTLRQAITPDEWQGRMNGSFHLLGFGGSLLGALLGGWIGEAFGLRAAIVIGAAGVLVATIPLIVSPVRSLRAMPVEVTPPA
jgi:MFS family permease